MHVDDPEHYGCGIQGMGMVTTLPSRTRRRSRPMGFALETSMKNRKGMGGKKGGGSKKC